MTLAFIAALVAVNIAYIWKQDRDGRRLLELQNAHRLELAGFVGRTDRERAELLQRIQAPEIAVQQHAALIPVDTPEAIDSTDDEDFWKAREEAQEAIDRIDRLAEAIG